MMKVVGFLPSAPLSTHNDWRLTGSQGHFDRSRCRLSMVSKVRWKRGVALKKKRDIVIRHADGNTAADVIEFFQKYSAEEKTLVKRRPSEIEQWIQDKQVLIAQNNGNCIGVARLLKLDMMCDSLDPIVEDFNSGSVAAWHAGLCGERSGLMRLTINNAGQKVVVDRSASVYISSLCMHRPFRKTSATLMLIHAMLGSVRKSLRVSHQKLQYNHDHVDKGFGLLFGTAVHDQDIWKLACKCLQKEVTGVFGTDFNASYLTFRTSYPDGSPARGNFVYFLPPHNVPHFQHSITTAYGKSY